jgi:hypothetical protein
MPQNGTLVRKALSTSDLTDRIYEVLPEVRCDRGSALNGARPAAGLIVNDPKFPGCRVVSHNIKT